MRSSSRIRSRPLEFWNFEKPDYSASENISYNVTLLCSNRTYRNKSLVTSQAKNVSKRDINASRDSQISKARSKSNEDKEVNTTLIKTSDSSTSGPNTSRSSRRKTKIQPLQSTLFEKEEKPQKNRALRNSSKERQKMLIEDQPSNVGEQLGKISSQNAKSQKRNDYNDSGVTDLDDTCFQSDNRPSDISNISHVLPDQMPILRTRNATAAHRSMNNSYSRNHRAPNFKGILSSTAVSESNLSELMASKTLETGNQDVFKVPVNRPKKIQKTISINPGLPSIIEEKQNSNPLIEETEAIESVNPMIEEPDLDTVPVQVPSEANTPKNSSKLIRSRILRLEDDTGQVKNATQDKQTRKRKIFDEPSSSKIGPKTVSKTVNVTTQLGSTLNESQAMRRSGRVCIKPLEFWNFEKAEVQDQGNGQLSIVYTKCIDPSETSVSRSVLQKSSQHPALSVSDVKKLQAKRAKNVTPAQTSSGKKRKMFTPEANTLDTTVPVPYQASAKHKIKSSSTGRKSVDRLVPAVSEFKSLDFYPWNTEDFSCFMARSYSNASSSFYSGFLYLKHGKMIWNTTKLTTIYVINGKGSLMDFDSSDDGTLVYLEKGLKTIIGPGRKLFLLNTGSKILKLFLILRGDKQK